MSGKPCAGKQELFLAEDNASQVEALSICEGCPEKVQCLEDALVWTAKLMAYGLERQDIGVCGGTTPEERRLLCLSRV